MARYARQVSSAARARLLDNGSQKTDVGSQSATSEIRLPASDFRKEERKKMKLTGAQILMEVLKEEGVNTIFGFPGGAIIDIYDGLARTDIRHYLVRHEQGAVHAADGYARANGKVGVCLVTSGPGATNTVTGIASAYMDSIPVVVISGQVPTHLIGNDAFQEVDIVGITRPCTKHNYLVQPQWKHWPGSSRRPFTSPDPAARDRCWWTFPRMCSRQRPISSRRRKVKLKSYNPTYKPNRNSCARWST